MGTIIKVWWLIIPLLLVSCSAKDNGAQTLLDEARRLYQAKEYTLAKQQIDSISARYPKSIDERKAALALLDSVRRDEQLHIIAVCDSLIDINTPLIESLKKGFVFQRDKKYQEKGFYIPKETASDGRITSTMLRSGVEEDGKVYVESIFVGGGKKHNKVKVSVKDGSFAETLAVNDDGLNYRFSNMGVEYEIIKFGGTDENGLTRFISANKDKPLTLSLEGQAKYSYTLSPALKTALSKSHQLSTVMLQMDSLKTEKEKAEIHIKYLNEKQKKNEAGE